MNWLQHWEDVLFLHFPVSATELACQLPPHLEIDPYDGQAWLSYVFFRLKLRPSWLPFVPGCSSLLELNVRTYVRHRGQPGICFLRMYADNRLAILASRWLTPLCYEPAAMIDERSKSGFRCLECHPASAAESLLSVDYEFSTDATEPPAGSFDAWLLERYRLFVAVPDGRMLVANVEHPPWRAKAVHPTAIHHCPDRSFDLSLPAQPALVHHSPGVSARFYPFRVVAAAEEPAQSSTIQAAH